MSLNLNTTWKNFEKYVNSHNHIKKKNPECLHLTLTSKEIELVVTFMKDTRPKRKQSLYRILEQSSYIMGSIFFNVRNNENPTITLTIQRSPGWPS